MVQINIIKSNIFLEETDKDDLLYYILPCEWHKLGLFWNLEFVINAKLEYYFI